MSGRSIDEGSEWVSEWVRAMEDVHNCELNSNLLRMSVEMKLRRLKFSFVICNQSTEMAWKKLYIANNVRT